MVCEEEDAAFALTSANGYEFTSRSDDHVEMVVRYPMWTIKSH